MEQPRFIFLKGIDLANREQKILLQEVDPNVRVSINQTLLGWFYVVDISPAIPQERLAQPYDPEEFFHKIIPGEKRSSRHLKASTKGGGSWAKRTKLSRRPRSF